MRLLSLTIDGFKSFAYKTTINFQPGMTGIIGPNGSGKSNIIEAIRWVMGEQSAKSLRGGKMADVIFNGSKDHQQLNRALVQITLDNSDHYLPSDYSEVTICRKLYRNGESEYLLNGHQVRLKDIVNLFVDSGIGRESFSIISQGRVAAIFNGTASDRRSVVENVAGVSKYKHNKQDAEKRLAKTHDNLNRVNDIIAGLKERIDPLAEESALAKDYLEQKSQLDLLDRTKTVRSILTQRQKLDQAIKQQEQAQQLVEQYEKKLTASQQQVNELRQTLAASNSSKDELQDRLNRQVSEIAELKNQQSLAAMRSEQRGKEKSRLQQRQLELNKQLETLQDQTRHAQEQVTEYQKNCDLQKNKLDQLRSLSLEDQAKLLRNKIPSLQGKQMELLQEITSVHNQQTFLKQAHERSLHQVQHGQDELAEARQAQAAAKLSLDKQNQQLKDAQQALKQESLNLAQEKAVLNQLNADYAQRQRQWYQALGNVHSTKQQLQAYQAMMADYTGYYTGVSAVLKQRQQFPGLYGAVSELISVPDQYTTAFETVLASQLQQLVVDNQTTAKQIIQYLVHNRAGRATILPLDSLRSAYRPRRLSEVQTMPGFIGAAGDLLQYDRHYQRVIDHLLANTVVVDSLDHATAIANAGQHQLRVVTLDGQLINVSGAMTGGANRKQRFGLLSQKQREQRLGKQLADQENASQQLEANVQQLKNSLEEKQQVISELQSQVQTAQEKVAQLQTDYQLTQKNHHQAAQRVQALAYENEQQTSQHDEYADQQTANDQKAEQLQAELDQTKNAIEKAQADLRQLELNNSDQQEKTHQLEQQIAVEQERLHTAQADLQRLNGQKDNVNAELTKLQEEKAQLDADQATTMNSADTAKALSLANENLSLSRKKIAELNQRQAELNQQLHDIMRENDRLHSLQTAAMDDLAGTRSQRAQLSVKVDNGLNRLSERYQMTLEEAQQKVSDLPDEELNRQLKLIHRGLDDLGEVNVGAINEYQEVKTRYDFLSGQQADLLSAQDQLQATMKKMDGEVKQRFLTAFNDISASFTQTFSQIFAGGRAKLVLTDPQDLLTTGIDIVAQPPGKKNQQLSLLSGGEKALTAIALLFAILKVRPVPFAILDEPEAALDDVNVDRFANYLERFGDSGPQFLVITHRKGTMRNADVLYGVTMQESGISRVVSVDVKKALQQDET